VLNGCVVYNPIQPFFFRNKFSPLEQISNSKLFLKRRFINE